MPWVRIVEFSAIVALAMAAFLLLVAHSRLDKWVDDAPDEHTAEQRRRAVGLGLLLLIFAVLTLIVWVGDG